MHKYTASRTARKVALNIITLGAKPGMDEVLPPGIVEATSELLIASGAVGAASVRWSRSKRMVSLYEAFDWMMPGQFEAFGQRKAFCERKVREGIVAGATQVLVLGAGYDTLGWRLSPEFTDVNFFEIDHPATASLKAIGLERMGLRDNLHLLAEDLGERKLEAVLSDNNAWDKTAQSIIVAEGLLMYLPPTSVRELFQQIAALSGTGSRIAFTFIPRGADGMPDVGRWTRLVLWILKNSGEPWLWSISPEELGGFLSECGWSYAPEMLGAANKYGVEYLGIAVN